jgi:spoIIIJ-associated protein
MSPTQLIDLVRTLTDKLDVEVTDVTCTESGRTVVNVVSPDSKRLIGPHGEHLQALNTIARRLVESTHRAAARTLAQRVRLFKHDEELPPMTAYERLVIHEMFANDPQIETISQGEEKFRHIVLKFRAQP